MDPDSIFGEGSKYRESPVFWVVVSLAFILGFFFTGPLGVIIAAGVYYYWKENKKKGGTKPETGSGGTTGSTGSTSPVPNTNDTLETGSSSLVDGPRGLVRSMIPDGYENFSKRYRLMVPTRSVVTVELVPESGPPVPEGAVGAVANVVGYDKEEIPVVGEYYAEPPQRVVSEVKRRARRDIDTRKVRSEVRNIGKDGSGKEMVDCGTCTIEADVAEDGFRYSVSYGPEYAETE